MNLINEKRKVIEFRLARNETCEQKNVSHKYVSL